MSDTVIRVENLSKRYVLGARASGTARYDTFRDALVRAVKRPFARLRPTIHGPRSTIHDSEFWALREVSFEVKRGEVLGIIGRNGAGKSTLLKILSRITEPTSGRVAVKGRVASLLEVGTGFHPELSGRENIFLNGVILGMTRAEVRARFDEIVDFAEVEKFLDTPVKHYSSGMYVRLAFAVAAHLDPEILIVDEVLAVGDAEFQKKCLGKIRSLARGEVRTVLFVSHNMAAVRSLCDTGILLSEGRVVECGPVASVCEAYLRVFDPPRTVHELATEARTGDHGSKLLITQVEFNDGTPLRHGEGCSIRIWYNVKKPVTGTSVAVGFRSVEGARILTLDSDLEGGRWQHDGSGGFCIEARIDHLPLEPGDYAVDVGARSGDLLALDYLGACGRVEVIPGRTTPSMLTTASPHVRLPAVWSSPSMQSSTSA